MRCAAKQLELLSFRSLVLGPDSSGLRARSDEERDGRPGPHTAAPASRLQLQLAATVYGVSGYRYAYLHSPGLYLKLYLAIQYLGRVVSCHLKSILL